MKSRYKRKAWYLDEDILLEGYTDKRGFHPNKGIQCGFGTQGFTKRDIGKVIFYNLIEALETCGNPEVVKMPEKYVLVSQGIEIFRTGDKELAEKMRAEQNAEYYKYREECAEHNEATADNEVFMYEEN